MGTSCFPLRSSNRVLGGLSNQLQRDPKRGVGTSAEGFLFTHPKKEKKGEEREDLQKRRGPGGVSWEDPRVGVRRKCGAERLEESCWSRKGVGEGAACLGGEKRSEEEKPRVKFRWDGEAEGTARAARQP